MADCCDNGTATNLKQDLSAGSLGGRRYRAFRFDNPVSPIPAQIEDADEYKRFFSAFDNMFVPFAGTDKYTSHSLLGFLLSLAELSPTQSGIIQAKKRFAFGGKVKVVRRQDPVFDLGEVQPVSAAEQTQFFEFLKLIGVFDNSGGAISVRDFAKYNLEDDEATGNTYFEMVRSEVSGQRVFNVFTHRPTDCLYLLTGKDEARYIAVSPIWTYDYIRRNPPTILPTYPNWVDDGNGVQRTMVHIKNGNYTWYGRPLSMASMLDQFFEFQNADYKSKQTATQFVGQALIEVEDSQADNGLIDDQGAQSDGFSDTVAEFEQNFTNKAHDPQRVLLMSRPYGSRPAFVFQFSPNTQEQWFRTTGEDAEKNILKSHAFPKRLLGMDEASGFSTNVYLDAFNIYDVTINTDIQTEYAATINDIIIQEAAEFFEIPDMANYGIQFQSPFVELLKQNNGNQNANNAI